MINQGGAVLQLTSISFSNGGNIPKQFTCEGEDISPELSWSNAPSGTKTFALIGNGFAEAMKELWRAEAGGQVGKIRWRPPSQRIP